jgi:hypothetical protein
MGRASPYLTPLDIRHQQNVRIQELVKEVRSLPNHENFMRGLPFNHLVKCAGEHAVVVLIAVTEGCSALVMKPMEEKLTFVPLDKITIDELNDLSITAQLLSCEAQQ